MSLRTKFSSKPLSKTVNLKCAYNEKNWWLVWWVFFTTLAFQEAISTLSVQWDQVVAMNDKL